MYKFTVSLTELPSGLFKGEISYFDPSKGAYDLEFMCHDYNRLYVVSSLLQFFDSPGSAFNPASYADMKYRYDSMGPSSAVTMSHVATRMHDCVRVVDAQLSQASVSNPGFVLDFEVDPGLAFVNCVQTVNFHPVTPTPWITFTVNIDYGKSETDPAPDLLDLITM